MLEARGKRGLPHSWLISLTGLESDFREFKNKSGKLWIKLLSPAEKFGLRKQKRHCDFIIKVGSDELFVHRSIICANSTFFNEMLTEDTEEKRTGVAEIKDVDEECTVKCVDFIYTGETSIEDDKCEQLLHVATMFKLGKLHRAIGDVLRKKLNIKTYFAMNRLATKYDVFMLLLNCNRFAADHLVELAEYEEFKQLDTETINLLIFSHTGDDCSRFKVVLDWVKYDLENRSGTISDLMKTIDMTRLPLSYRNYLLRFEPLIYTSALYLRTIGVSMAISMNLKPEEMDLRGNTIPLQPREILVFDLNSRALQSFDIVNKLWRNRQALPPSIVSENITSVLLEKYLYVLLTCGYVYRIVYSNATANWERIASKDLCIGPVVLLNGTIYTSEYERFSNRVEKFDPDENKWTILPGKKMCLCGEALAACEGAIFCIGGMKTNDEVQSIVEKFNPSTGTWTEESPLNKARCGASTTILKGAIYVLGGCIKLFPEFGDELQDVEFRCPKTKSWTTIVHMKVSRSRFSTCVIDGRIYCLGGLRIEDIWIEEFDPNTELWRIIAISEERKIARAASLALPIQ